MSAPSGLVRRACETYEAYHALGNECIDAPLLRIVRNREAPNVYDANHVSCLRARSPGEIEETLVQVERAFEGFEHRSFHCDPGTAPDLEARLCLEGYRADATLQMILEDDVLAADRELDVRLATLDADWAAVARLTRLDHDEQARIQQREPYSESLATDMTRLRRARAPALHFWLAREEGADCAFFSSLPGENGVGMVEDLFTHPDFRRRGIATALISHAVADARERGAGPILIGARPDDTPKDLYARLGFRPLCVTRNYLKTPVS
ncbi:MAG: GNAT family N-acetyltransferase [Myxococcota bacterium]